MTNRGKLRILEMCFAKEYNDGTQPSNWYIALLTSDNTPDATIETMSAGVTEIATGNGYDSGGVAIAASTAGFDVILFDTDAGKAYVQAVDAAWTASEGNIPASGTGARWAVLTDDNAVHASREVLAWLDLTEARSIGQGAQLTLQNIEIDL